MRPTRLAATLSILSIALATGCSTDSIASPEVGRVTPPSALSELAGTTIACPPTVPPGYTLVFCFDFDLIPGVWHGFIVHQPGIPNALSHDYLLISPTGFQYVPSGSQLDLSVSNYTFQPEFNGVVWNDVFRLNLSNQSAPQRVTLAVVRRALTPAQQTEAIAQQIAALVSAGTLSSGLANSLTQQLDAVIASLDAGQSNPAANVLNAFVRHVLALMSGPSPALSAADGQMLVNAAQAVIARISPQAMITPLFDQLALGPTHGCVVQGNASTACWGSRIGAAIGDGQPQSSAATARVIVAGNPAFSRITSHAQHSCGQTTAGGWLCWGRNTFGEALGNGTGGFVTSPTALTHGPYQYVTGGLVTACALTTQLTTYCWGINQVGELGDGTTTPRLAPVQVVTSLQFVSIEGSWLHNCGLTTAGAAHCWGAWQGQMLTSLQSHTPVPVPGGHAFIRLFAGGTHTCGLDAQRQAWCWGDNATGQLGDGTTTGGGTPVLVQGGLSFVALAAGMAPNSNYTGHTCGLTTIGQVYCWGLNDQGQLGDGTTTNRPAPTLASSSEVFVAIAAGTRFTCAMTADRRVFCWGTNANGELGSGVAGGHSATPGLVP